MKTIQLKSDIPNLNVKPSLPTIDQLLRPIKQGRKKPMYNRSSWRKLRVKVLERDRYSCTQCGKTDCRLEVDHIIERSDGGADLPPMHGLQTLCMSCHQKKTIRVKKERNVSRRKKILKRIRETFDLPPHFDGDLSRLSYIYDEILKLQEALGKAQTGSSQYKVIITSLATLERQRLAISKILQGASGLVIREYHHTYDDKRAVQKRGAQEYEAEIDPLQDINNAYENESKAVNGGTELVETPGKG